MTTRPADWWGARDARGRFTKREREPQPLAALALIDWVLWILSPAPHFGDLLSEHGPVIDAVAHDKRLELTRGTCDG